MKQLITYLWILWLWIVISNPSLGQRINFSTWTQSDEITITPVMANPILNFNSKQSFISANSPAIPINLSDNQTVAFRIEAPEGFDLTIEVDSPTYLGLDGSGNQPNEQIPFQIGLAYSNLLAGDEISAKASAIQLPVGFTNVTFPVSRRSSGAPTPPPTPISGDYVRPKSTAWLFLYGQLGPVGAVDAGSYLGNILINVYFNSND